MVIPRDLLTDQEREALHLAGVLREQLHGWMSAYGVTATVLVTPYVDRSGQPNVLVRLDARLALAMILSVRDPRRRADAGTNA